MAAFYLQEETSLAGRKMSSSILLKATSTWSGLVAPPRSPCTQNSSATDVPACVEYMEHCGIGHSLLRMMTVVAEVPLP